MSEPSEHTKNIEAIKWNESPDIDGRWHQALAASRSADALERIAGALEMLPETLRNHATDLR